MILACARSPGSRAGRAERSALTANRGWRTAIPPILVKQALRSMTSRGFTIAIVAIALAIGMGRAPCSAAPAVSTQSIDIAERAEIRRAGSGSDFFQFPAYSLHLREMTPASRSRRERRAHTMICPPLAVSVEPVMRPASSETRNRTQRATSSGSPRRPIGMSGRTDFSSTSLGIACTISVAM
jgi:hypothetical protein